MAIRSKITDCLPGAQCVMLTLRLQSGENVCVSMFDSKAPVFHRKFDSYGKEPRVVLATSLNPKIVGGRMFLNATSGTHLYFDFETDAGKALFESLTTDGADQMGSSSKVVHAQKIEPLTLSELNQFITVADSQVFEFLCTAKVTGIQQDDGWCYIGCSGRSKKLVKEISSFTCVSCNETNALASLRYRVTMSVSDSTDTASFLAFDLEMTKLTSILASEAAQIVGVGVDAQVDTSLPRCLAELVGKTFTFQLKLNDFNFTSKHKTFIISRIFPERDLAPMPAFIIPDGANNAEEGGPAVDTAGVDGRVGDTGNDAEKTSTSDAAVSEGSAWTHESGGSVDKTRKKARVE